MEGLPAHLERDLDLNLLRVLVVVADAGSVTAAADRLYLTQPAVSAALGRLGRALGEPVVTRQGRQIALTARGRRVLEVARPHLRALVEGVRSGPTFDPASARRTFRVGLADDVELWLLPVLLRRLREAAPGVRLCVLAENFRTAIDALGRERVELVLTVADESPPSIARQALREGVHFECVYDPRRVAFQRLGERAYFAHEHVIVSYNGDLRGIVEDALGRARQVACSVSRFASVGPLLVGSPLLATVPVPVAARLVELHPPLTRTALPFTLPTMPLEMLWNRVDDDDPGHTWLRAQVTALVAEVARAGSGRTRR